MLIDSVSYLNLVDIWSFSCFVVQALESSAELPQATCKSNCLVEFVLGTKGCVASEYWSSMWGTCKEVQSVASCHLMSHALIILSVTENSDL